MAEPRSLRGRLLVALPGRVGGTFDRSVVLLLEHGEDGALGLVLNQPSRMEVVELVPAWAAQAEPPAHVFLGGPVEPSAALCLARIDGDAAPDDAWADVGNRLALVNLHKDPADLPRIRQVRVFAGHAGWGPDQLERELTRYAWVVLHADRGDAFDADPATLWRRVLRRQGGWLRVLGETPTLADLS